MQTIYTINFRIRNINEMDCFAKAFRTLLDTLDTNKFVLEKSEEAVAKAMERLEIRKMAMEEWRKTSGMVREYFVSYEFLPRNE